MTETYDSGVSRAPNFLKGTFEDVADGSKTAAIPTGGFNELIYTTRTAPTADVEIYAVDQATPTPNDILIPENAGIHVRVDATNLVGYLSPLPSRIKFKNTQGATGTLTIDYELRKSATHDRGH